MDYPNNNKGSAGVDDGIERNDNARYRALISRNGLGSAESYVFADPAPSGRQFLDEIGAVDAAQWALVALLPTGGMEEVRLDEPFDLRERGVERLVAFQTDRLYRAILQDRELLWGQPSIMGAELYDLARLAEGEALFLDVRGGTDRLIERNESVDLTDPGVERFVAGPAHAPGSFVIVINYGGLEERVRVHPSQRVSEVIAAVRPRFGNPAGDLVLFDPATGRTLESRHTIGQEGVRPGAHLQLRPPVVRGG